MITKEDYKFGDIFTNGINYYMIINISRHEPCKFCQCFGSKTIYYVAPVVMKDNLPSYIPYYESRNLENVKPYAQFVMSSKYESKGIK